MKTLRKAGVIDAICHNNALPPIEKLVELELMSAIINYNREIEQVKFLSLDIDGIYSALSKIDIGSEDIKGLITNRHKRRIVNSHSFRRQQQNMRIETWNERFGIPLDLSKAIVLGHNPTLAKQRLAAHLSYPSNFAFLMFDPSMLSTKFKAPGRTMWNFLQKNIDLLVQNRSQDNLLLIEDALKSEYLVEQVADEFIKLYPNSIGKFYRSEIISALKTTNFFNILINLTIGVFREIDKNPSTKISKESSASDIFHCLYLPYVDLFRTDKDFSRIIKSSLPEFSYKTVSKLSDLHAHLAGRS